jgi:hypothetical protein
MPGFQAAPGSGIPADLAALFRQADDLAHLIARTTLRTAPDLRGPGWSPLSPLMRGEVPHTLYRVAGQVDGVLQELYGFACVYCAVRRFALGANVDPDTLSFTGALRAMHRKLSRPESFSPHATPHPDT